MGSEWYDIDGNVMTDTRQWSENRTDPTSMWARAHLSTTVNDDTSVSTVWLGLDHSYGDGPPLIFETMIFGGNLSDDCERYATLAQAHAGHAAAVEKVKSEAAAFADIASAADIRAAVLLLEQAFATHREQFDMGEYGDLYAPLVKATS